jgi:hypothetical protein
MNTILPGSRKLAIKSKAKVIDLHEPEVIIRDDIDLSNFRPPKGIHRKTSELTVGSSIDSLGPSRMTSCRNLVKKLPYTGHLKNINEEKVVDFVNVGEVNGDQENDSFSDMNSEHSRQVLQKKLEQLVMRCN